ncbi:MAG: peroxidase-related enzyme, partial [Candidatus Thermoplasmatota archaeon]|nr:peroxidase-related enzyme [Candidatus Thermoplasmatota archaeon]
MSWIQEIPPSEASDNLQKHYQEIISKRGKLSNVMQVHSLNPESMKLHMDLYVHLMYGSSPLSREDREFIAVVVSIVNNCQYCIKHHAEALLFYWKNQKKIDAFVKNPNSVNMDSRLQTLFNYIYTLTKSPDKVTVDDVVSLRNDGFTDRAILDIGLIVGYFNFVNR